MKDMSSAFPLRFRVGFPYVAAGGPAAPAVEPVPPAVREALQRLALALAGNLDKHGRKSVIFTSARMKEGTTTVMLALAREIRQCMNIRTLVVELNRLRPTFMSRFGLDPGRSVYAIAMHHLNVEDCIQEDPSGLPMIPAGGDWRGSTVAQISDQILRRIDGKFDLVLFDTPAILESADAVSAGTVVKNLVLVVKAGATSADLISQVRRQAEINGMNIVGSVLTVPRHKLPRWLYR